jgi:deoxyribonuclease-4
MLVGAHVSTAGGLVAAHERAVERGCEAMQVFNQSPRAWRPTRWKPDDVAEFLALMKKGPVESATIHAVYLINPATKDREMRKKSADSLIHALRMGDEIGPTGSSSTPARRSASRSTRRCRAWARW